MDFKLLYKKEKIARYTDSLTALSAVGVLAFKFDTYARKGMLDNDYIINASHLVPALFWAVGVSGVVTLIGYSFIYFAGDS